MVWEATPAIASALGAIPHDAAFPESLCGTSLPLRVALTPTASRCPRSPVFQSGRIRIRICTVVLRRSAGNIGARRLLTSTRGLLTSTGTGSCTCFFSEWHALEKILDGWVLTENYAVVVGNSSGPVFEYTHGNFSLHTVVETASTSKWPIASKRSCQSRARCGRWVGG